MNNNMRHAKAAMIRLLSVALLIILVGLPLGNALSADPDDATRMSAKANKCKERMLEICAAEQYKFTAKVRQAFLDYSKAQAKFELQAQGKSLPDEFLAWIDSDPEMEASVYGTRLKASNVLLMLYSLRLDLGKDDFQKYRQLAMATAVAHAKRADEADITPRKPLKLVIGDDPRKLINTKDAERKLDKNDHIINFLNDNTIEEDVVVGHKKVIPEVKYDDRGVAIAPRKKKGKTKKIAITEKRSRSLHAADVIASKALQEKFNAYMKSHGYEINIDCGERVVHWKSRKGVRGEQNKRIDKAYRMFKAAYESKGLLPTKRDPVPSPAKRCAFLIRNDKYRFPPELEGKRNWPRFPLDSPWPVLTMLVADKQPLRERQERWVAFRDSGEFKTYGEHIGPIAQQYPMQSARRLTPYAFSYGSIQMMLKDGGVCGTMGTISARSHNILGIPSSTAGQPGHCAMVAYRYQSKKKTYVCQGGQYARGGDAATTPSVRWFFGDVDKRKAMVYHQSIAWAVNYSRSSYLDSNMVYTLYRLLPDSEKKSGGIELLEYGLGMNPYNFLLVDATQARAASPQEQIQFWKFFKGRLAAVDGKAGCPSDGLYNKTVKERMFVKVGKLPLPEDKKSLGDVLTFLQEEGHDTPATIIRYRVAFEGLSKVLLEIELEFKEHLNSLQGNASRENRHENKKMAARVKAVANSIKDKEMKKQWALKLWIHLNGREKYFGKKYKVYTDESFAFLTRQAGKKMPSEKQMMVPILGQVSLELKKSLAGEREVRDCRHLAVKIKEVVTHMKDPVQKQEWLESLSKIIAGKETFQPSAAKKNAKPVRDPCSEVIKEALEAMETS